MAAGGEDDDVQELWNFDELDELEAQQSSSDGEAEKPAPQDEAGTEREEAEEAEEAEDKDAKGPDAAAEAGGGLRDKLDFLFGPGGSSDSEEEEEDDDEEDWEEGGEARPKREEKEKQVFEDPRKKLTNVEDQRLRGERVPLQEKVRQRLTRIAEARVRGVPPGPPGPPPPPPPEPGPGAKAGGKRPATSAALLGEQPLAPRPVAREQRREQRGRMHDNVHLREKGASDGAPVTHECRGARSEGLPGVPAPVLLKRACRRAGASSSAGFARPSILALAMAEAQEATARAAARQAEEANRCAHCQSPLENPMRCSQCLEVCYCSRECQRQDWKLHKRRCGRGGSSAAAASARPSASSAAAEPEDSSDPRERQEEAERQRQEEERQRLEEQRRERLEQERRKAEEARQERTRLERARTAALRQQRMEEARRKSEKQRQEREAQRAREEEEARQLEEESRRRALEAEEKAKKRVEMAAYEDYLLAQLKRQELLEAGGSPPTAATPQQPTAAPVAPAPVAPAPAPAPQREPQAAPPVQTQFVKPGNAYNLYKRHQPSMGQRLAALGMDELRGF